MSIQDFIRQHEQVAPPPPPPEIPDLRRPTPPPKRWITMGEIIKGSAGFFASLIWGIACVVFYVFLFAVTLAIVMEWFNGI